MRHEGKRKKEEEMKSIIYTKKKKKCAAERAHTQMIKWVEVIDTLPSRKEQKSLFPHTQRESQRDKTWGR